MRLIDEVDVLLEHLKDYNSKEGVRIVKELRDKYIKLRAENYARITQPQPEIHIHIDKDGEVKK